MGPVCLLRRRSQRLTLFNHINSRQLHRYFAIVAGVVALAARDAESVAGLEMLRRLSIDRHVDLALQYVRNLVARVGVSPGFRTRRDLNARHDSLAAGN